MHSDWNLSREGRARRTDNEDMAGQGSVDPPAVSIHADSVTYDCNETQAAAIERYVVVAACRMRTFVMLLEFNVVDEQR